MPSILDELMPTFAGISPTREMGAYEALWLEERATFKTIAASFAKNSAKLPSELVREERALETAIQVRNRLAHYGTRAFDICVNGMDSYPIRLRDAKDPIALFYYQGWLNLVESAGVAVVGTRKPSDAGRRRARQLVTKLVAEGWTIISGLASGIDTEAHTTALQAGGKTIAVIGTPISQAYPRENADLQKFIARNHLVISQVPLLRYEAQHPGLKKLIQYLTNVRGLQCRRYNNVF